MLKRILKDMARGYGYEIKKIPGRPDPSIVPDAGLYTPFFSPWYGEETFLKFYSLAEGRTLVSADRCYVLFILLSQALRGEGDIWECGVYKGGTAAMLAGMIKSHDSPKKLYLFDTFQGMPETDSQRDLHKKGDFSDTSLAAVQAHVGHPDICIFREGFIPGTFTGLESSRIALVHIDLDIHRSITDSLSFAWPRLSRGGFIIVDDYGAPSCPGARQAVDDFFLDKSSFPLCLQTGQALIFKSE